MLEAFGSLGRENHRETPRLQADPGERQPHLCHEKIAKSENSNPVTFAAAVAAAVTLKTAAAEAVVAVTFAAAGNCIAVAALEHA